MARREEHTHARADSGWRPAELGEGAERRAPRGAGSAAAHRSAEADAAAAMTRRGFLIAGPAAAGALFIAGGDQWNYVRVWGASPMRDAMQSVVDRGAPVGGTSAGLAVLGQFVYTAEKDTVTSAQALADPYHERVTVGEDFLRIP